MSGKHSKFINISDEVFIHILNTGNRTNTAAQLQKHKKYAYSL